MNTKTFYVSWTYLGNYSDKPLPIAAESPQAAINKLCSWYSQDFAKMATIMVYDKLPVATQVKGVKSY